MYVSSFFPSSITHIIITSSSLLLHSDDSNWEESNKLYLASLPDYMGKSSKDLWELRPLRICPCPICHGPNPPTLPPQTKRMLYPPGSMTSTNGKSTIILKCNFCKYRTAGNQDTVDFLTEWIKNLNLPLLSPEARRQQKGGHRNNNPNRLPTPAPSPKPTTSSNQNPQPKSNNPSPNQPNNTPTVSYSNTPNLRRNPPRKSTSKNNNNYPTPPPTSLNNQVNLDLQQLKQDLQESLNNSPIIASSAISLKGWLSFSAFLSQHNLLFTISGLLGHKNPQPAVSPPGIPQGWKVSQGFIEGDGNCLFRAFCVWSGKDQRYHSSIRKRCVRELKLNQKFYKPYVTIHDLGNPSGCKVPQSPDNIYNTFLQMSATLGFWGGDQHLAALANTYNVRLVVLTDKGTTTDYKPRHSQSSITFKDISIYYLWYNGINHYEIIWNPSLHILHNTPNPTPIIPSKKPHHMFNTPHLDPSLFFTSSSSQKQQLQQKPASSSNTHPLKKFPVVVIPKIPNLPPYNPPKRNLYPWEQEFKNPLINKKLLLIPGFVANHNLPTDSGYWSQVNKTLHAETGHPNKRITYVTIPFCSPRGLAGGWRISHNFIKNSSTPHHPDPTGLYHALAYWSYGDQDLYLTLMETITCQTQEQINICQGNPPKLYLFYSFLDGQYKDPQPILKDLLYKTIYGAYPPDIAFFSAACLLKAVIILIQTDPLNPASAKCLEYRPVGLKNYNAPLPSVYLFLDHKIARFQILWNPIFHQCPEITLPNPPKRFKSTPKPQSPLPLSSSPHVLTIRPSPTPSTSIPKPPSPISLKNINRSVWSHLENKLSRHHFKGQSYTKLPSALKDISYFETGNFNHIGWRLTINYIQQDQHSMWRALSLWAYQSQDMFHLLHSRFQKFDYNFGIIPEDKSTMGIFNTLRTVSSYYQVSIYLIHIHSNYTSIDTFHPPPSDFKQSSKKSWYLYKCNNHFEILYDKHHFKDCKSSSFFFIKTKNSFYLFFQPPDNFASQPSIKLDGNIHLACQ